MGTFSQIDMYWMRRALALARRALGKTQPNPLVGAIVLDTEGRCVGKGYHERAGGLHAEILALEKAGIKARGGTLYVSLEPCTHHGRTPPCADQILRFGVARVVIASEDPNPHVQGGGANILRMSGLDVQMGCLETLSRELNAPYFHWVTRNRPFVTAKIALSLDGRIGAEGKRLALSGDACVPVTMRLRAEAGAILVGVGTILTDDPSLNVRGRYSDRVPIRGIIDPHLRTPPEAKIFSTFGGSVTIFCYEESTNLPVARSLKSRGAQIHPLPRMESRGLHLEALLNYFKDIDVTSVLVEGGSAFLTTMAKANLIDRWVLYLTPQMLGPLWEGRKTLPVIQSEPFRVNIRSVIRRGDDWQVLAWPK